MTRVSYKKSLEFVTFMGSRSKVSKTDNVIVGGAGSRERNISRTHLWQEKRNTVLSCGCGIWKDKDRITCPHSMRTKRSGLGRKRIYGYILRLSGVKFTAI